MNVKILLGLLLIGALILGILILMGRLGGRKTQVETIEHPPFTIQKTNRYGTRYDFNTARRTDNSRSSYSILYRDQLIEFPEALNRNTGLSGLWKAYILKDAPRPAILAASKSVYLITEENQQAKLTPVGEEQSGFARLQWLDSMKGQPGTEQNVYSSDDTGIALDLTGGRFLLINQQVVLDVADLSLYPFQRNSALTEGYYADAAFAFSPDQDKIVYIGNIYEEKYYYAILTYNFKSGEARTLPFDQNETRLHDAYNLPPDWFPTYFEWREGENGSYQLEKKLMDTPPPWTGHFENGEDYSISPVKQEMLGVFAVFAKEHLALPDSAMKRDTYSADEGYELQVGDYRLGISYQDTRQAVYFYCHFTVKDKAGCAKVIQEVGEAFNAKLKTGAHQELFTAY